VAIEARTAVLAPWDSMRLPPGGLKYASDNSVLINNSNDQEGIHGEAGEACNE
jgi:hypothetical protein